MAEWLKAKLFGRQLSYGSETEEPTSFEEALQSNAVPNLQLEQAPAQQQQGPLLVQQQQQPLQPMAMPNLEQLQLNFDDDVSEWWLP